jgi:uncharacterized protein with FMN-binding domain
VRRITIAVMSTLSALVALFSYHTSTNSPASVASTGGTSSDGNASVGSSDNAETYTGAAADTRWGVVQVEITVQAGKITKSDAIKYPTENPRDQEINAYAVPQLNAEVVQNQNGTIDAVSGATVTSDGYIQSLQSAIDQANLG